jgi:hypothetical protein
VGLAVFDGVVSVGTLPSGPWAEASETDRPGTTDAALAGPVAVRAGIGGGRQGKFDPPAVLGTKLDATPDQVLGWFIQRWQLEVTFEEVRAHLGVEPQRQWSHLAMARTTPILLDLFSIVTLTAHTMTAQPPIPVTGAAWYSKPLPTFSDALALVRSSLWWEAHFSMSLETQEMEKVSISLLTRFTDTLCYAR